MLGGMAEPEWIKVDLHIHTLDDPKDALDYSAHELLERAAALGFRVLAITLHDAVFDRAEVLKVAAEMAREYGVADRIELVAGDMFADPFPVEADIVLLSNILHDWDVPECEKLIERCAAATTPGGRVVIHDVFLDDDLTGPLPLALYSAALFTMTEGRAYSAAEYREMLTRAKLKPEGVIPTLIHCGLLAGRK